MALITCKDCNRQFTTDAKRCPNCGAKKKSGNSFLALITCFFVMFLVMGVLSGISDAIKDVRQKEELGKEQKRIDAMSPVERAAYNKNQADKAKAIQEQAKIDQENENLSRATSYCQDFVTASLHDPGSAELDDHRTYPAKKLKNGNYFVQVKGRAKNGFGALRYSVFNCITNQSGNHWFPISIKEID